VGRTSVPTVYMDTAVRDGIVKRVDRILEPGELRRRLAALMVRDTASPAATIPDLTARLGETGAGCNWHLAPSVEGPTCAVQPCSLVALLTESASRKSVSSSVPSLAGPITTGS
jgi:hypothetical protein